MKKLFYILLAITFIGSGFAQLDLKKIGKKIKKEAENRTEKQIDKGIDKTFDKIEEEAGKAVNGENGKQETVEGKQDKKGKNTEEKNQSTPQDNRPVLKWNKYDFVPGDVVIFEDNLENEQNGEFPSKWDLVQGSFENAEVDGENVILHKKCNMNGGGGITPMLKNSSEDYLPEEFTIEFDAYFDESVGSNYSIYLADYKNQKKLDKSTSINEKWIRIYKNSADAKNIEQAYYPGFSSGVFDKSAKWRHVAISFNKRALKVYLDDARVLNIPNLGYNPTGFSFGLQNVSGKINGYTKNFRLAKGAVPLYDKFMTDGKIITNGIKFDVNKAIIKPESMGVINEIFNLMNSKPEINFSVEGHTDSDGDDSHNLKLSEERAKAVMQQLISMGISKDRLKYKGLGESKPLGENSTTEGKANNRRVEFVKF